MEGLFLVPNGNLHLECSEANFLLKVIAFLQEQSGKAESRHINKGWSDDDFDSIECSELKSLIPFEVWYINEESNFLTEKIPQNWRKGWWRIFWNAQAAEKYCAAKFDEWRKKYLPVSAMAMVVFEYYDNTLAIFNNCPPFWGHGYY